MADETTTDTAPEESEETAAAEEATTDETSEDTEEQTAETDQEEAPASDDNKSESDDDSVSEEEVDKWLASQNLDPAKPEDAKKLAKIARDSIKDVHASRQEVSELRKAATDTVGQPEEGEYDDPLESKVAQMEAKQRSLEIENSVTKFYVDNPDARTYDAKMAEIVKDKPWLAGDLDSLYVVAKSQSEDVIKGAEEKGRKEALLAAAAKQRAGAPSASAQTREGKVELSDEAIGKMTPEEYNARRDEVWAWYEQQNQ